MGTLLFIPALLAHDMDAFYTKLGIVVLLWFVVIGASMVDLVTGIQASRRLGTKRTTSWGLRRTINKDLQYLGVLAAFLFIDFAVSALSSYISIFEMPLFSIVCVVGITLIEGLSVRENVQRGRENGDNHLKDVESLAVDLTRVYGNERMQEVLDILQKTIAKLSEKDKNVKHQE